MRPLACALLLLAGLAACGGAATPRSEPGGGAPASCADSPGPWTACAEAASLRRAVEAAGYEVVGDTGSAWIAAGSGRSFFVWSTRRDGDLRREARAAGATRLAGAGGRAVWDDGVRRFWAARGRVVWVEAGPAEDALAPEGRDLERLVAATRRTPPA